jgi:uncharacterized membrane protein YecN with MAPEG domain
MSNVPVITAVYAAIFGLFAAALTINVIANRVRLKVEGGDGGVPKMAQAIRAHANFAEHVPLAIILIGLAEMSGVRAWIIYYVLGGVLLVARVLSAVGLNRSLAGSMPRQAGAGLTILVTVAASIAVLVGVMKIG